MINEENLKRTKNLNSLKLFETNLKNGFKSFIELLTKDITLTSLIGIFIVIVTTLLKLVYDLVLQRIYFINFSIFFKELSVLLAFTVLTPSVLLFRKSYLKNRISSKKEYQKDQKRKIIEEFVLEDQKERINTFDFEIVHDLIEEIRTISSGSDQEMFIEKISRAVSLIEKKEFNDGLMEIEEIKSMLQSFKRTNFKKEEVQECSIQKKIGTKK